jgi:hypothetical protein
MPAPQPEMPAPETPAPQPEMPDPQPEPETPESTFKSIPLWSDAQCVDYLKSYNIADRWTLRKWMFKNHPDRGGDAQIFANVLSCADRMKLTQRTSPPPPQAQPVPAPPTQDPPTSMEDCTIPNLYFENTASGDCLFESVAQVYVPIDKRDSDPVSYEKVLETSKRLRTMLADTYRRASQNKPLQSKLSIPSTITDAYNRPMTLEQYADFIAQPGMWGTDTDLEVLARVLNLPFHVIEHSPDGKKIVRDISGWSTSPAEREFYTMCNINNLHWVLKKHASPQPLRLT